MTEPATPASSDDGATDSPVAPSSRSRRRWPLLLLVALAVIVVARGLVVETFTVPTGSMEPALAGGDRIVVWKPSADEVRRGDVIVFDGRRSLGPDLEQAPATGVAELVRKAGQAIGVRQGEADYVKRVIGVGGDRVRMDEAGRVSVNGRPLAEPYASRTGTFSPFDITVPPGRLWVMGDNRGASEDSRNHLGSPGGGTVPVDDVIGQVVGRYWPLDRAGGLEASATLTTDRGPL